MNDAASADDIMSPKAAMFDRQIHEGHEKHRASDQSQQQRRSSLTSNTSADASSTLRVIVQEERKTTNKYQEFHGGHFTTVKTIQEKFKQISIAADEGRGRRMVHANEVNNSKSNKKAKKKYMFLPYYRRKISVFERNTKDCVSDPPALPCFSAHPEKNEEPRDSDTASLPVMLKLSSSTSVRTLREESILPRAGHEEKRHHDSKTLESKFTTCRQHLCGREQCQRACVLEEQLARERAIALTYHDDWELLQDEVSNLSRKNALLEQKVRQLQLKMAVLKDEYNLSRFVNNENDHSVKSIHALTPVRYDLIEKEDHRIGHYKLLECVGCGSFARVFKACRHFSQEAYTGSTMASDDDTERNRISLASGNGCTSCDSGGKGVKKCENLKLVAIKIISKSSLDCMSRVQQLENEVRILKMPHPNKLLFIEVLHTRDSLYIITDYAYTNVHAAFSCGHHAFFFPSMESRQAAIRQVLCGLSSALCFLHSQGIAHLDVKPENILLVRGSNEGIQSQERITTIKQDCDDGKDTALVFDGDNGGYRRASDIFAADVRLCDFGFSRFCDNDGDVVVNCSCPATKNEKCSTIRQAITRIEQISKEGLEASSLAFVIGTPLFFAPEMVVSRMGRSSKKLRKTQYSKQIVSFNGQSADMWSVGATLLDLTVGFSEEWVQCYAAGKSDPARFEEGLFWCMQEMDLKYFDDDAYLHDLLMQRLLVQSSHRFSAEQVLLHPWITAKHVTDTKS